MNSTKTRMKFQSSLLIRTTNFVLIKRKRSYSMFTYNVPIFENTFN